MTGAFYDRLAPLYTDFFEDWDRSIRWHAGVLDGVIREYFGPGANRVLDAACGIGTQSLGLASLGYQVTASDISAGAVARARVEAEQRGLPIDFHVADMRDLPAVYSSPVGRGNLFDLVIACDNAIPHLLSDGEIRAAFEGFYRLTTPQGGCILSVRDYAQWEIPASGRMLEHRRVIDTPSGRRILVELREFTGRVYTMTMYFIEDNGQETLVTRAIRGGQYYCVTIDTLEQLLSEAGFQQVTVLRERYFQPLLIGKKQI